ncbi:Z-ring formation inhibitor MciZ [Cohnella sp. REN36]|uniref:Z-ring formation inhibitor MciZ n=1 Tax=Cohnella sp. REN36 TaxID=2887347 RepID=UPI001D158969|nr:Z-ring formation inhibitor MciZ [Cohnella sp. REN36]MCC3373438.1 Z-ring formation inhibitor MciZ [Cohnella sp. REN36]
MLKRYAADGRIRWVGKAWEIRQALRQERKRAGDCARLADVLPKRTGTTPRTLPRT